MVPGVALPAFPLAFDVDRLARHRLGLLVLQIVEFAQVARREAELPPDVLERVVLLGLGERRWILNSLNVIGKITFNV